MIRSAVDNSKNSVSCSFMAKNLVFEPSLVTPVLFVFSVSIGTCVLRIWNMLNAASVDDVITFICMYR